MPRLYRPHIPLEVRCRVALRQLGEMWPDEIIEEARLRRDCPAHLRPMMGFAGLLRRLLSRLADCLGCEPKDLRLDHDPALATRQNRTLPIGLTIYYPDANDPAHLIYREKHAHHIKTNVRGEHGQHPDRVLIKKERKRRASKTKAKVMRPKMKGRPLRSASRWPKRKIENRRKP